MDVKAQVLETMKSAAKPISAGEIEKLSGLDRKEIDKGNERTEGGRDDCVAGTLQMGACK